jgi:hypothetical protein
LDVFNYGDTGNYWVLDISDTLKNTTFRKLDLFPSSGERAGNIYCVGYVREY